MADIARDLPPLATLVVFDAAFRHGNFTRAADELFMSQASVSRRIRELETDLGANLFERGRHDVTPTAEAERFAPTVRWCLRELSATAAAIRRAAAGTDSLTILADPSLTAAWVAPIIGAFQRHHPDLRIRVISSCEAIERTVEDFDIALQYGDHESSAYRVRFLADEDVFPVCSPEFAERVPGLLAGVTIDRLVQLPLLDVEYENPSWATWHHVMVAHGLERSERGAPITFSSYEASLDVASKGEGIALGWQRSVVSHLQAGRLVRVPGITLANAATINAYQPDRDRANQHAEAFLDTLVDTMSLR